MTGQLEGHTEYYRHIDGLVSPAFHNKRILAVGCGAGSYLIEALARLGPAALCLVDNERVHLADLTGMPLDLRDVGALRVDALARRVRGANPVVEVDTLHCDLCEAGQWEVGSLIGGVDLIIAHAVRLPLLTLLNRWSQRVGVPAVFVEVHEQARSGRIVWTVPGRTPCYRCVNSGWHRKPAPGKERMQHSPQGYGLLPDVQFIDMVACKVCLALLERGQGSAMARFFEQMAGRNEIVVRTSPDCEIEAPLWDARAESDSCSRSALGRELGREVSLAMDTLWLRPAFLTGCPDCGGGHSADGFVVERSMPVPAEQGGKLFSQD